MSSRISLEVCVDSVESAIAAVDGGADRLEICSCLGIGGGLTPSLGLVRSIQRACPGVDIMVMIRPRTGDFFYSDMELQVMQEDIACFKSINVTGVVLGVLRSDGTVDDMRTRLLVESAHPLEVTFHRAFDMTCDFPRALAVIESIPGITRLLASGIPLDPSSGTRVDLLRQLMDSCSQGLAIMPGSGIRSDIALDIASRLPKLSEIHMSGGAWLESSTIWRREGLGMGTGGPGEWGIWRTSRDEVRAVRSILDGITAAKVECLVH